jgi:hypothetical protein
VERERGVCGAPDGTFTQRRAPPRPYYNVRLGYFQPFYIQWLEAQEE